MSVVGRLGGKDGVGIVVRHTHIGVAEVCRSTIDSVDRGGGGRQAVAALVDMSRHILMRAGGYMTIGQHLSEEDVVIGPDGVVLSIVCGVALVVALGDAASGVDEVTVFIVFLYISEGIVRLCLVATLLQLRLVVFVEVVGIPVLVIGMFGITIARITRRYRGQVVVVTLVEVEAVEVIGHLTVIEGLERFLDGRSVIGIGGEAIAILSGIVAVDDLHGLVQGRVAVRVVEHRTYIGGRRSRGVNPAVLDIACAIVHDTCRGEATLHAEVIDIAAELTEEGVGQAADGVAVAVEYTLEAL